MHVPGYHATRLPRHPAITPSVPLPYQQGYHTLKKLVITRCFIYLQRAMMSAPPFLFLFYYKYHRHHRHVFQPGHLSQHFENFSSALTGPFDPIIGTTHRQYSGATGAHRTTFFNNNHQTEDGDVNERKSVSMRACSVMQDENNNKEDMARTNTGQERGERRRKV